MIDLTSGFGVRVAERLERELIIWLVTVHSGGLPQPSPVWFHWDGATFLTYSRHDKQKLRNIATNPQVALHLDSDGSGGNIVIVSGRAELDVEAPALHMLAPYVAKYGARMAAMGMTPEVFAQHYSAALRVTPTKLRAF